MSTGYLRISAIAEELDVSPRTVLRWVERGDLQAVRLPGGRLRISQTAFDAFVGAGLTARPVVSSPERMEVRMGEIKARFQGGIWDDGEVRAIEWDGQPENRLMVDLETGQWVTWFTQPDTPAIPMPGHDVYQSIGTDDQGVHIFDLVSHADR